MSLKVSAVIIMLPESKATQSAENSWLVVVGGMAVQKALEGYAALEDYLCELREVLNGE